MCAPVGLDPIKRACPNQISPKKATNGPNKIFFGLYEQHQPTGTVLDSTQLQMGQIHFMTQTVCHNWHATSGYVLLKDRYGEPERGE
jgi:hypothetical protein